MANDPAARHENRWADDSHASPHDAAASALPDLSQEPYSKKVGQDEGDERYDQNTLSCQVADAARKELSDYLSVHPQVKHGHD